MGEKRERKRGQPTLGPSKGARLSVEIKARQCSEDNVVDRLQISASFACKGNTVETRTAWKRGQIYKYCKFMPCQDAKRGGLRFPYWFNVRPRLSDCFGTSMQSAVWGLVA